MSRVVGADEFLRDLQKLGDNMPRVTKEMLQAGGEQMAVGWRKEIDSRGFVSVDGQNQSHMRDHVAVKVKTAKGRQRAEITSLGTDDRGVSNAAKAFFLHYGTSRIQATHWIDQAEDQAMPAASAAMGEVLDQALHQTIGR